VRYFAPFRLKNNQSSIILNHFIVILSAAPVLASAGIHFIVISTEAMRSIAKRRHFERSHRAFVRKQGGEVEKSAMRKETSLHPASYSLTYASNF
jgi:hypothetical protein